jgi:hypothetical protein
MREATYRRHYLGSHTLHNLVGGRLYGLLSNDRGKDGQKMRIVAIIWARMHCINPVGGRLRVVEAFPIVYNPLYPIFAFSSSPPSIHRSHFHEYAVSQGLFGTTWC